MACSLDKVKRDSLNTVRSIFNKDTKSVTILSNGDVSIKYSKNINTALDLAKRRIVKVNEWSNKKFNQGNKYKGQWTKTHTSPKDVRVEITFPSLLEQDYQAQDEQEQARAVQRADAKRASQQYDDRYQFDYLTDNGDGYNYGLYLKNKVEMRNYLANKINTLEQASDQSREAKKQIHQLKLLNIKFNKDIKNLKSEPYILKNYFNYFHNDIKIINEILLENPSIENLLAASNFIIAMEFVYNTKGVPDEEFLINETYSDIEDPEAKALFKKFNGAMHDITQKIKDANKKLTVQEIVKADNNAEDKNEEEIAKETSKIKELIIKLKDRGDFSKWLLALDGDTDANPLQKFVKKIYDYAIGKKETFNLQQNLNALKPNLEARLKQLGYTNTDGFLNKLRSKVSYDIFKRKTSQGNHRLIDKFSQSWTDLQYKVFNKIDEITQLSYKKNKDIQDFNRLNQLKKASFLELQKNDVNFIDVRRIPEIINDPEFQTNFGGFFIKEGAKEYKEKLIQSLIGKSGNRQVAEKAYNEIVKEQIDKLTTFDLSMEYYREFLFKEEGVNTIAELSVTSRNNLKNKYYTESPFSFAENYEQNDDSNVRTVYIKDGKEKEGVGVASMEYISYLPTKQEHFDERFANEIETDPILYEAWELFSRASTYINRNKAYTRNYKDPTEVDDTLNSELDMMEKYGNTIQRFAGWFSQEARTRAGTIFSTSKFRDENSLKLNGTITSIDDAIRKDSLPLLSMFKAQGYSPEQIVTTSDLKPDVHKKLLTELGKELPKAFKVSELVYKISEKNILSSQQLDLIDTLTSQLEIVEKFKAQKEIESKLLFARNQLQAASFSRETLKTNAIESVEHFITLHLYGANNRANYTGVRKSKADYSKVFSVHEREMIESINTAIDFIEEQIPNMADDKAKNEAMSTVHQLQELIKSKGRVITAGSIIELMAIKLPILVGLGLNVPSQMKNYFMGNISGRQNDGLEWTEGNFPKSVSYLRKWKIGWRKLSKTKKANYQLTNALISGLNIFQNSANEIDRVKETNLSGIPAYITNPLHIVGEVEKTIQRPQILSALADLNITDKNGNKVPVFNVNDTNNPHPAFEMVNGVLKLKPEFDTTENRATWIQRNSDEYASLFSNSGKIPELISRINGDYRETSIALAKSTTLGAMAIMFKTWLTAFILRRYGKKEGVISNLVDNGRGAQAISLNALTASTYAMIGVGIFASPFITIGLTAVYLGKKKWDQVVQGDKKNIALLGAEIQDNLTNLKFLKPLRYLAVGAPLKVLQQTVDRLTGKRIISNDTISNLAGFTKEAGETADEYDKSKARLHFLLTELSTSLSLLGLKILAQALLFPDDDEDKDYKDTAGGMSKLASDPKIAGYYMAENFLTGVARDMNLMNDAIELSKMGLDGTVNSFYGNLVRFFVAWSSDDDHYLKGPNEGRRKTTVALQRIMIPRGLQDIDVTSGAINMLPTFGVKNLASLDYEPGDMVNKPFISDYKTHNKERLKQQKERKKELLKEFIDQGHYDDEDVAKKKADSQAEKEFPSIKKLYYEDGSLIEGMEYLVEKYD